MGTGIRLLSALLLLVTVAAVGGKLAAAEEPSSGPQTEKRFPPLVVPPEFAVTLFACDPLVEYPSVIALGPKPNSIFVAHDYMTGLGTEITRRDEIRLLEDTDGDGYADKSTIFAGGFNSIQGLAFGGGRVFAMHAPVLTALRDTNGDGVADERHDLLSGFGLPPEQNPSRLHSGNGVTIGHDGWLYLALGDHGADVNRPEGDRLLVQQGGILRCRPDGSDLHVFATGLRNIYDVALDAELNVFVRDNENDGGDYMIRVCHSFFAADHGYPYLYYERPDEAMRPLADLGRGSSAGGACYLETAFPAEFHGNLFFCEWGRSVVRYQRQPQGSSFAPMQEIEFAAAAQTDPYGLKPTDLIVDRDGSLMVADWGDGQRPKRGRGRIYRIAHTGSSTPLPANADLAAGPKPVTADWIRQLNSSSYHARVQAQDAIERAGTAGLDGLNHALRQDGVNAAGRLHAVWIIAHVAGERGIDHLFELAGSDLDPAVRVQAVRAIADLTDPVITRRRLAGGPGDPATAARLASVAEGQGPRVVLAVVNALGRLRWPEAPNWLAENINEPDSALAHAAMQTLRRCDNWPAVINLLDEPDSAPLRGIAFRAIADRAEPTVVDGLIDRLRREPDARRRLDYADALTRVYQLPAPWVYWGYRPPPRPANTAGWERSAAIAGALDRVLADPERELRAAILKRMLREKIPTAIGTLAHWLSEEREPARVQTILDALSMHPAGKDRQLLASVVREKGYREENRLKALSILIEGIDETAATQLLELAEQVEDGPVLVELLVELGRRSKSDSRVLLLGKLVSSSAPVRAAALDALARLRIDETAGHVPRLLADPDPRVRRAAASAAGVMGVNDARGPLLKLALAGDALTRGTSLEALRKLDEPRAVPAAVAALGEPPAQLAALDYLAAFGGPEHIEPLLQVSSHSRAMDVLARTIGAFASWEAKVASDPSRARQLHEAIATVQGESGTLMRWVAFGPFTQDSDSPAAEQLSRPGAMDKVSPASSGARIIVADGTEMRVELKAEPAPGKNTAWLAYSDVLIAEPTAAQCLGSCNAAMEVWLNGSSVYERKTPQALQPDSDRFDVQLQAGMNRLLVRVEVERGAPQFHLRFRRRRSSAEQERLAQYALQNSGNAERGRDIFLDAEKSLCVKCHRLDQQGGNIGPDLTRIGSRFSRIHVIESILDPSRTVAPSYETISVALADGLVLAGVKVSEDDTMLVLGDQQSKTHEIRKTDIEQRRTQPLSTMPEGLEKRLTDREFLDLLAFLLAQK